MTARVSPETSNDPPDAAAYGRLQQANHLQIGAKLLHDLRNPLHSLRITIELFGRLAQPQIDATALLSRAARYAPAADAAIEALSFQVERLATLLSPPRRPALQPVPVNALLSELAALLRDAAQPVDVEVQSRLADDAVLLADRPRLSHALLAWLRQGASATLGAYEDADGVWIEPGNATGDSDVRTLLAAAGGRCAGGRVLFKRP